MRIGERRLLFLVLVVVLATIFVLGKQNEQIGDFTNVLSSNLLNVLTIIAVIVLMIYMVRVNDMKIEDTREKTKDIIQHIDIMPSILSYLNYPKPFKSFGANIFDKKKEKFAINYNNNYQLVIDNKSIIYSEINDEITNIYDLENDPTFKTNILNITSSEKLMLYKQKIKAFIQTYNNTIINNELQYEG